MACQQARWLAGKPVNFAHAQRASQQAIGLASLQAGWPARNIPCQHVNNCRRLDSDDYWAGKFKRRSGEIDNRRKPRGVAL